MTGAILAIASAISFAISSALIKNVSLRVNAVFLATIRLVTSAIFAVLTAVIMGELHLVLMVPPKILVLLIGSGFIMVTGHLMFVKAIALDNVSRVLPTTTGLYIFFSVLFSILLGIENISWQITLGGFVVLLGVYLLSFKKNSAQNKRLPKLGLITLFLSVCTSLTWAIGVVVMDEAVNHVKPIPASAVRICLMALIAVGVATSTGRFRFGSTSKFDLLVICASGFMIGASILTFVAALRWSTPATVVILNSTAPFFLVPIALIWLRERFTLKLAGGTIACFIGIVLTLI